MPVSGFPPLSGREKQKAQRGGWAKCLNPGQISVVAWGGLPTESSKPLIFHDLVSLIEPNRWFTVLNPHVDHHITTNLAGKC
jgi:hypothetical protein